MLQPFAKDVASVLPGFVHENGIAKGLTALISSASRRIGASACVTRWWGQRSFRDLLWACGNPAKFENETQHTEQLRPRVPKQCWKSCRSIASSASKQLAPVAAFPSIISEVWTIVSDLAKWKMFGPAVSPVRLTGCSVWNNKRETIWFHTLPPSQPLCFQEGQSSSTFWKLVQWVVSHRFSLTGSFTSCLTDIDSVRTRVRGREASGQTGRT